jgi:dihydrolipoamide dehydrogenase
MHDLIVIGAGPAGYSAAERAGKAGLSTLLIEKDRLGGVCLNEGCIPSKTLLHSSKLLATARASEKFGVSAAGVSFNLATVMARKQKIVDSMRNGISFTLKKNNVETLTGEAMILGRTSGVFTVAAGGDATYETKRLLICTGSTAVLPPIPGIDRPIVNTNREMLAVSSIPSRLVVIGAGAIGLEFATFFAEAGSTVSVIEMLPNIGGMLDKDIGSGLRRELEKKGIRFFMESKATEIGERTVTFTCDGKTQTLDAEIVLASVGRKPVVSGFGIESIGVACERGSITTDVRGRTNVDGVWAAGDVNGVSMLAHTAYREAQACINDMLGRDDAVNYRAIPSVIYTHPEAASVGLTKEEAAAQGYEAVEIRLPMTFNGRYTAETEGERGIIKAVTDTKSGLLLGMHMLGGHCSEMIFGAAAMIEQNLTADDVSKFVFPHPTVSEIIKDVLAQAPL